MTRRARTQLGPTLTKSGAAATDHARTLGMMETTLHRQLKALYGEEETDREVPLAGFRIDAIHAGELIEIQCASLAAIRPKVVRLLREHRVCVVKPLAARKIIVKRDRTGGTVTSRRASPRKESIVHLFDDLVYFVNVFPHPGLTIHVVLTEQEEHRIPRKNARWRRKDYVVTDRRLVAVGERISLQSADDLQALLPPELRAPFTTEELGESTGAPRWLAQKMAYCMRKTGALDVVGKRRNALLYERANHRAA